MKAKLTPVVLVLAILAFAGLAFAHHGSASYSTQPTTLKNVTVTKVNWGNPHTLLLFDVKDDKGEHAALGFRSQRGLSHQLDRLDQDAIKPGDTLTVVLYAAKNGRPLAASARWCWRTAENSATAR